MAVDPTTTKHAGRLERDTLALLLQLSTECASRDEQINNDHQQRTAAADRRRDRVTRYLQNRYAAAIEQAREQLKSLDGEHQTDDRQQHEQLETGARKTLTETENRYRRAQMKLKQEYEQSVWLADSVLEATQNKLSSDKKRAFGEASEKRDQIKSQRQEIEALLVRFRQTGLIDNVQPDPDTASPNDWPDEPDERFDKLLENVSERLEQASTSVTGWMISGFRPWVGSMFVIVVSIAGGALAMHPDQMQQILAGGIGLGVSVLVCLLVLMVIASLVKKRMSGEYATMLALLDMAQQATEHKLELLQDKRARQRQEAIDTREGEVQKLRNKFEPKMAELETQRREAVEQARQQGLARLKAFEDSRQQSAAERKQAAADQLAKLEQRCQHRLDLVQQRHAKHVQEADAHRDKQRQQLQAHWQAGGERIRENIDWLAQQDAHHPRAWDQDQWQAYQPDASFPSLIRFGDLHVDMAKVTADLPSSERFKLDLPVRFSVPALLVPPDDLSLMIDTDLVDRDAALSLLQTAMARLLFALPPGRARFVLLDPVGLGQSFAGFMHLADHDEALVGSRIWSEAEQIDRRLADLTEHMENVIQKYLRNEYDTIDQYNTQAGELAEPYRFLVVSDFPHGFSDEAMRRLSSIAASGARCGVHLLVMHDRRLAPSDTTVLENLKRNASVIVYEQGTPRYADKVRSHFDLQVEPAPSESLLTDLLNRVGAAAQQANRVEVSFDTIAPKPDQLWTRSTTDDLHVPVGRSGATRLQDLSLGRGVAQHALIAGKTGSGKSTLLHVLVTNLAMWHHPDEVEFYLVDFKKGVEFKTYAVNALPHARAIAIESEREFGLSVLIKLDEEMTRRGENFRRLGVQNLAGYRALPDQPPVPRTLLIIDEFQEFFSDDDRIAQESALLLDRLVRQGRAFGIHVLLGSQTLAGGSGLPRATMGQMAVRIALQCSEADSQLIMNDDNTAARLLSRPGEAIYNDMGGLIEGNSPFQVAWLDDDHRDDLLKAVIAKSNEAGITRRAPIVFEGNVPADAARSEALWSMLRPPAQDAAATAGATLPTACLGEPVAIKPATTTVLARQPGANVMLVGQNEEAAVAMLCTSMLSLAGTSPRNDPASKARFVVLDGVPIDSPAAGRLQAVAKRLGDQCEIVAYREAEAAISNLANELHRRQEDESTAKQPIFLVIAGLQRYRALRRSEDDFSFSMDDQDKPPAADKLFNELITEGPSLGMHTITWVDTAGALDRVLDRIAMREFDERVLFQMSASDSSNLIDSPAANQLGLQRALLYSEQRGTTEKFRPFALPDDALLDRAAEALAQH